jgi:hypothetical protein
VADGTSETTTAAPVAARAAGGIDTVPARRTGRPATVAEAARRAAAAGITAVWTGDCSATILLAKLTGPRGGPIPTGEAGRWGLVGTSSRTLADPGVRAALYTHMLTYGSAFDCYRWVNLLDLAAVWRRLDLPRGLRAEWHGVLRAAGLL